MGGGITLQFALEKPDRLAGIVLVGTGARLRVAPEILTGVQTDLAGTSEKIARWCYAEGATPEELALYAQRTREAGSDVLHGDFTACDTFDRLPDVGKIELPTLIVVGEADRMTPVKYSERLHEQIAGSELVVVPGAGHMVMLEQPAAVRDAVRNFLDNLG